MCPRPRPFADPRRTRDVQVLPVVGPHVKGGHKWRAVRLAAGIALFNPEPSRRSQLTQKEGRHMKALNDNRSLWTTAGRSYTHTHIACCFNIKINEA